MMNRDQSKSLKFVYSKDGVDYYKSAYSNNSCVTVGVQKDESDKIVAIRVGDSKNPEEPPKVYTIEEWDAFLNTARSGGFDPVMIT